MRLKSCINSCWYQHNNSIGPINNNVEGTSPCSHHSLLINHEICDQDCLKRGTLLTEHPKGHNQDPTTRPNPSPNGQGGRVPPTDVNSLA